MGKLYANRPLLGNIALVVFLAFLASLAVGLTAPAEASNPPNVWVQDKDGQWQSDAATLRTDADREKVELTIRIAPLTQSDFQNIWFKLVDAAGNVYATVYNVYQQVYEEIYDTVYGAGYQFVYSWVYAFTDLLPLENVQLVVYLGDNELESITLTIEAPPPEPSPGPGPAPEPETVDTATGTVEVADGQGTLVVDEAKVRELLADPADKTIVFAIPAEAAAEGTVKVSADLLAEVFAAERTAVVEIGGTKLTIPPGALDLAVFEGEGVTLHLNITRGEAPVAAAANYRIAGEVYNITIEAYADGERKGAIRNFTAPVALTLPYDPAKLQGAPADYLAIYRYNEAARKWECVPGSRVDKDNQVVTVPRDSLSLYTVMVYTGRFADLAGHWAEHDVHLMAARGIVAGITPTTFAPHQNVTRAQFAALLIRTLGITEQLAGGGKFTDVAVGAWYAGAVETAAAAGLVGGYPDGSFKPDANITRQELAAMVVRGLAYQGKDVTLDAAEVEAILARFTDATTISPWAREVAAVAADRGIVGGRPGNAFAPLESATRAEAVVMLKRMLAAADNL
jgi:hypothetical protein